MGGSNYYRKHHNTFNRCHSQCPLSRGCPLVGGSIIGGSTVVCSQINDTFQLGNSVRLLKPVSLTFNVLAAFPMLNA